MINKSKHSNSRIELPSQSLNQFDRIQNEIPINEISIEGSKYPNPGNFENTVAPKLNLDSEDLLGALIPRILKTETELQEATPYLERLKSAVSAKNIRNIAITGGYGSGKSTILKTFQFQNQNNYKFLNISLASFSLTTHKKIDNEVGNEEIDKNLEKLIEISILQQIIYKVDPERLPNSRFKRIENVKSERLYTTASLIIAWIWAAVLVFKYNFFDYANPKSWSCSADLNYWACIVLLIFLAGIGYGVNLFIDLFKNSKIRRVSIAGEIELGDKLNQSVFNQHLEEIIYFFEKTQYKIVIFEDLDRFEPTNIFTKLREINIILNNIDSLVAAGEIKFIYAIGDGVFKDKKDRVKFFDYIIPIIPFINSSNAQDQLEKLFKKLNDENVVFQKGFVSNITTFIDDIDMRLLINIFHEFMIYRELLNKEHREGREEELLSLIVYKNLEPDDFQLLYNNSGKLFDILISKKQLICSQSVSIDESINNKNSLIEKLKNQPDIDIRELRRIYVTAILDYFHPYIIPSIAISEMLEDDVFDRIQNNSDLRSFFSISISNRNYNFKIIEDKINPKQSYKEREELIKEKVDGMIIVLQREIDFLALKKSELELKSLSELLASSNVESYFNDFSTNNLLRSLVSEGYINENFNELISHFHSDKITKLEEVFIRNVRGRKGNNFNYELQNFEEIVQRLEIINFKTDQILNNKLVSFIVENKDEYKSQYEGILNLLNSKSELTAKFLLQYFDNPKNPLKSLVRDLLKNPNNFFHHQLEENPSDNKIFEDYIKLILRLDCFDELLNSNPDDRKHLKSLIENMSDFLKFKVDDSSSVNFERLTKAIDTLGIEFIQLDDPIDITARIFRHIIDNNRYKLTKENILLIIIFVGGDSKNFKSKNFTTIKKSGDIKLIQNIESNISEYIESIYIKLKNKQSEDEEYFVELLNNKSLEYNLKNLIVDNSEIKLKLLSLINDSELKKYLHENKRIELNWDNLISIYDLFEKDVTKIVELLNESTNIAFLKSISYTKGSKFESDFWGQILDESDLAFDSFKFLIKTVPFDSNQIHLNSLTIDKVKLLIESQNLKFDNETYNIVESSFNSGMQYLFIYKDELIKLQGDFEINEDVFTNILNSVSYTENDINIIYEKIKENLTIWNKDEFFEAVRDRLTKANTLVIQKDLITNSLIKLPYSAKVPQILANYYKSISKSNFEEIINNFKDNEIYKFFNVRQKGTIKLESHNKYIDFFNLMKSEGYISTSSIENKDRNGFIMYSNKNNKQI
ncbi:YobI family P-loop NTPase [Sphingobacterium bovistauri]|uniref:YobI-like P-loop NTPase domain-containing protein n=1 Tax=Sphingobacterium bovistauri TaxID=2781959 RepID=A0ABS7Z3R6_9SPHI|nr:hypothetical protein [Sphingobacterium bovistauri]MCA5004804.1 hypothetical protein [Sphingobacterium bovistauri]